MRRAVLPDVGAGIAPDEEVYRALVYDAMVVALSGRIQLDETSDPDFAAVRGGVPIP